MADWLLRAKREFAQSAGPVTANTAERNPTAVTAVPDPGDVEISWASIGSNGSVPAVHDAPMEPLATTAGAMSEHADLGDDRRTCDRCANLTGRGLCLAARRGDIVASRNYEPIRDLPRRCEGYVPGADDTDRRPGRERWPGLTQKGDE